MAFVSSAIDSFFYGAAATFLDSRHAVGQRLTRLPARQVGQEQVADPAVVAVGMTG